MQPCSVSAIGHSPTIHRGRAHRPRAGETEEWNASPGLELSELVTALRTRNEPLNPPQKSLERNRHLISGHTLRSVRCATTPEDRVDAVDCTRWKCKHRCC